MRAAALQREEDRVLEEAMCADPGRKRTRVNVTLSIGSSTSRATLHAPALEPGSEMQLRVAVSSEGPESGDASQANPLDTADTSLMQTSLTNSALLEVLQPAHRGRVLRRLRALLRQRLQLLLHESCLVGKRLQALRHQGTETMLPEGGIASANDSELTEALCRVYMEDLQAEIDAGMDGEQDLNDLLQRLRGIVAEEPEGYQSCTESRRRRSLRLPVLATERKFLQIAEELLRDIQQFRYTREGTARADMLRELVATLVEGVQVGAARMLVLLHLVGHYLPQPFACASTTPQAKTMGRNYALDVLGSLEAMFESNAARELDNEAFGVQDILAYIGCLSPMATQVMIFLEDGYYDMDDVEGDTPDCEGIDDTPLLPPWMLPERQEDKIVADVARQSRQQFLDEQNDTPGGPTTEMGGATSSTSLTTSIMADALSSTTNPGGEAGTGAPSGITPSSTTTRTRVSTERGNKRTQRKSPTKKSRKGNPQPADDKDSIRRFLGGGQSK